MIECYAATDQPPRDDGAGGCEPGQFEAIMGHAANYQFAPVAMFLTLFPEQAGQAHARDFEHAPIVFILAYEGNQGEAARVLSKDAKRTIPILVTFTGDRGRK